MQRAIVFDPSVGSFNKGDAIIYEAVADALKLNFPELEIFRMSIHQPLGRIHRSLIKDVKTKIVAGSNVISSVMHPFFRQSRWNLKLLDYSAVQNFVYMGAGWAGEEVRRNTLGKYFLSNYASKEIPHSVRDAETKKKLEGAGIQNVVNTGCPTAWGLSGFDHPSNIDGQRIVVTTVTDNTPDVVRDKVVLERLKAHFDECYIWFQGYRDEEYFKSLGVTGFKSVGGDLDSYTEFLRGQIGQAVYIGSRLHGGIRAMQQGLPSLILAIDHRALDMGADVGLNVVSMRDYVSAESLWRAEARQVKIDMLSIGRFIAGLRSALND